MRPRLRALLCAFVLASCDATGPDPADLPRLAEQVNDEMVAEIGQSVTLTVRAIDGRNRPVAGAAVLWQIMAGSGRVEPASSRTGGNGFATVAFFPGSGENHVVARVQDTNPSVSFAVHGCAACGVWTEVTALSAPRSWPGALVLDGSIWLIGGDDQANGDAIDIFETANLTWRHSTPLPAAVIGSFTATVQQRIYVIGGYGGRGGSLLGTSSVSALDPATGTWTPKSRLSQGRFFAAGAVLDSRIYVVGGYVNCDPIDSCFEDPLRSLEIYDPAADRWTAGPPMLDPRGNAGAAVLNGKLYVAGGSRGLYLFDNATATVEMFDPQSSGWSRKAALPTSGHIRLVTTNNKLYAVVTWWQIPFARIYEYDPVRDAWSRLRDAPAPGFGAAVVANEGQLYIIGGYSQFVPFWQISSSVYVMRR